MSVSQRQILSAVHKQNNKTVRTTRTHNKVIHNSHNINNHITKLSTLYHDLSTHQNIENTTLLHSYQHHNIKLSTPSHIVFNTTSITTPHLYKLHKISIKIQVFKILSYFFKKIYCADHTKSTYQIMQVRTKIIQPAQ